MQPNEYVKNVLVTESNNFDIIGSRFNVKSIKPKLNVEFNGAVANSDASHLLSESELAANLQAIRNIRLLHAAIGISTEVGELFEFLDKETLDFTNLKEEVGDAFWYCGIAADELKLDFKQMVQAGYANMTSPSDLSIEAKRTKFVQVLISATKDANVLLDLLKKSAFYGKNLDQIKFAETLSLFIRSMMATLSLGGFTVEEAMEVNIAKLKKRYGDKFTESAAITRNLDAERKILEGNLNH